MSEEPAPDPADEHEATDPGDDPDAARSTDDRDPDTTDRRALGTRELIERLNEAKRAADDPEAEREELIAEFMDWTGAIRAVEGFGVDVAIDPRETREWVARAFERSDEPYEPGWPPKKHGINPL